MYIWTIENLKICQSDICHTTFMLFIHLIHNHSHLTFSHRAAFYILYMNPLFFFFFKFPAHFHLHIPSRHFMHHGQGPGGATQAIKRSSQLAYISVWNGGFKVVHPHNKALWKFWRASWLLHFLFKSPPRGQGQKLIHAKFRTADRQDWYIFFALLFLNAATCIW